MFREIKLGFILMIVFFGSCGNEKKEEKASCEKIKIESLALFEIYEDFKNELEKIDPDHGLIEDWAYFSEIKEDLDCDDLERFCTGINLLGYEIHSLIRENTDQNQVINETRAILFQQQKIIEATAIYNKNQEKHRRIHIEF